MSTPVVDRMSPEERRAGASLASIFALRMLGLFLILPVFAVYAKTLPGGDNLALVGFALGAYGLTQAFFQIPYGIASDLWGRKLVIVIGLLIFALGSFIAAWAPDMTWIIVGRVVQGMGAISAAVTALAADLTREQHRTKVMAMIGSSIGLVFALSLVAAPLLYGWIGMGGRSLNDAGLASLIEKAFRAKPAAVALAINSPGGSAAQSSLIAARIRRLADEKHIPVHAFVEDVAASGGYWPVSYTHLTLPTSDLV